MSECQLCRQQFAEWGPGLNDRWVILDEERKWRFLGCEECWTLILARAQEAMRAFEKHHQVVEP